MLRSLFRVKSLEDALKSVQSKEHGPGLKRALGAWQLTLLGVGAIIGAGIFGTIGTAAAGDAARPGAGPSLMLSFVITAFVCALTAFCYAEFASIVPISGSAYTYTYTTFGEFIAWIIGWNLVIEYAIGNTSIAINWAGYTRNLLEAAGWHFPAWLATDYRSGVANAAILDAAPKLAGVPVIFNLLAFLIVMAITFLLMVGIRESARFNAIMVAVKIAVLAFFVGVAAWMVPPEAMAANWTPFQPTGWAGTFSAAAVVFFAYIGFDAVSTVAEETRNPTRDLPIGILASLVICTVFYILIAAVFTGIVPYADLIQWTIQEQAEPLTKALDGIIPPGQSRWMNVVMAVGAVVATTAVLLVFLMGQPRIFLSMARDGLLPPIFAKVHPRAQTPLVTTFWTGFVVAVISTFTNISEMVDLTNIGTLSAFLMVCVGIPILRRSHPELKRGFRVPLGPYALPLLGAVSCLFLMFYLPPASWWRFVGWMTLGLAIYLAYGFSHSVLGRQAGRPERTPLPLWEAAVGSLAITVGLYLLPHNSGVGELIRDAFWNAEADPAKGLRPLTTALIVGGGVLVVVGLVQANRLELKPRQAIDEV